MNFKVVFSFQAMFSDQVQFKRLMLIVILNSVISGVRSCGRRGCKNIVHLRKNLNLALLRERMPAVSTAHKINDVQRVFSNVPQSRYL